MLVNFRKIIIVFNHIVIKYSFKRTNRCTHRINPKSIMNHLKRIIVRKSILYQEGEITVSVEQTADKSVVSLLQRTIYGTNGPKFQQTGQEVKLKTIKNPIFFILRKHELTIGFCCLCEREVGMGTENYLGYHGRYFVIDKNHQGNNYGILINKVAEEYIKTNATSPSIIYGYLEQNNVRSLTIIQKFKSTSITTLETVIFSRLYPKADGRVIRIKESELPELLQKLESQNAHTIFRTFENINYQNNYFVIKENGRIVAGLQANPTRWKIIEMAGLGGKILLKVLPHIPILKRLINPEKYDFLAIEGIFIELGYEDYLYPLLEGVLHYFSMTSALIELDSKSSILKLFKERGDLGLLNAIKKDVKTHVMIKSFNCKTPIPHGEAYVSSFDFT